MPLASTAYARPLDLRFVALSTREALRARGTEARFELAASIAGALGPKFAPSDALVGTEKLPAVVHVPSAMRLVAIPGGDFTMGMTPDEIDEVADLYAPLGRADEARDYVTWATQPPRSVHVQPFLCAQEPVSERLARALLPDLHGDDEDDGAAVDAPAQVTPRRAAELRGALGFRFLAEAEWEWIAREGGARRWLSDAPPSAISLALDPARAGARAPNAFGFALLRAGLELVGDTWHPSYDGAPSVAIAWEPRVVPEHARGCHAGWQDEIEAILLHAGAREGRHGDGAAAVRFALDLP
jgi:formylglycine-generating enzyme required for sulfatase activity